MGFSTGHIWLLLILLVVVLIIWGPGKLPDVGAGLGRAFREFRNATQDTKDNFAKAVAPDERPAAAPPAVEIKPDVKPADAPADEQTPAPH